jgi:NitT/TauT family transport system substrate-binding protein
VSGAIDIGDAGVTSALYTLAGEGALKVIAGRAQDRPGFSADAVVASNRAYENGLTSLKALGGHSMGLTTIGSTFHYVVGMLAEMNGVDLKTVRVLPLGSLSNVAAAVSGGQADTGLLTSTIVNPLIEKHNGKLLVQVGDVLQWQVSLSWASTQTLKERPDMIKRYLRALKRASRDYHDAFADKDGKRRDGPTATAILAIMAKHLNQPVAQVRTALSYIDPDTRVLAKDMARQIAWFHSQGMIKNDVTLDDVLDRRFVSAMPE